MGLTKPRYHQLKETDYKNSCRVVSTLDVTISGGAPAVVDGVNLQYSDRVLVTGQTDATENGIYVVATLGSGSNGTWTRAFDADENSDVTAGLVVNVDEGTVNADTEWKLITNDPIVIGTTELEFRKNNASNIYNAEVTIGTTSTLIDSVSATGTSSVKWYVNARDNTNSRFKSAMIDSVTDGTNVYYTEYGVVTSDANHEVAEFTSSISDGFIKLFGTGDSASVSVTFQRVALGSGTTTGFVSATVAATTDLIIDGGTPSTVVDSTDIVIDGGGV